MHELQLYIIQTDLLHPIKKKFIASTNKENFPFVIKTYGRKSCYNFQGIRKKILPKTYGADAGDRNRTYRVTVQDGPTTPQRHICKKAQIKPIYNTNRFYFINKEEKLVTSANKEESETHNINYIVLIIILGTA